MTRRLYATAWAAALLVAAASDAYADQSLRIRLESEPLPKAISLDDDHEDVVGLQIDATLAANGQGSGRLGFDRSSYEFDGFGDASVQGDARIEWLPVSLETIAVENGSRTLDLALDNGSLERRLALVLSDGSEPHRLVVRHADARYDPKYLGPWRLFLLKGEPSVEPTIPALPLRLPASFEGLSDFGHPNRPGLHRLELRLQEDLRGSVAFDPNGLGFDAFGRVEMQTAMGYSSVRFEAMTSGDQDPAGIGRRRFELKLGDGAPTGSYALVLGPTDEGPHRLLVSVDGELERNLPLHLPDRRRHARQQASLERIPEAERRALAELRRRIGYEFQFEVQDDRVVSLHCVGSGSTRQVDDVLPYLTQLRGLSFEGMDVEAEGLTCLRTFERLTAFGCMRCRIGDGALALVGGCKGLTSLSLLYCEGIDDAAIRHLEALRELVSLRISQNVRDPGGATEVREVTDAGIEFLAGMTKLKNLNLQGQPLTDRALVTIARLEALEDLAISGEGVTDNGLLQFKPTSRLKRANFYGTTVSEVGMRRLRRTLPDLADWP